MFTESDPCVLEGAGGGKDGVYVARDDVPKGAEKIVSVPVTVPAVSVPVAIPVVSGLTTLLIMSLPVPVALELDTVGLGGTGVSTLLSVIVALEVSVLVMSVVVPLIPVMSVVLLMPVMTVLLLIPVISVVVPMLVTSVVAVVMSVVVMMLVMSVVLTAPGVLVGSCLGCSSIGVGGVSKFSRRECSSLSISATQREGF